MWVKFFLYLIFFTGGRFWKLTGGTEGTFKIGRKMLPPEGSHVWIYDILHSEIKFRAQYGFERFFSHTCYVTKIFCCMLPMLAYSCVLFQHFLNHRCKLYIYRRVVSKSGNPGPGPVPKTRAQIRIFFITSLLRH